MNIILLDCWIARWLRSHPFSDTAARIWNRAETALKPQRTALGARVRAGRPPALSLLVRGTPVTQRAMQHPGADQQAQDATCPERPTPMPTCGTWPPARAHEQDAEAEFVRQRQDRALDLALGRVAGQVPFSK
jgi:hypothetical protein